MKKLLLGALLFILSISAIAQETFVKKYNSMISVENGVKQPWKKTDVTVVFNPNHIRDIVIYYSSGKILKLHQIGDAEEGHTQNGDGYQLVECLDDKGIHITVQLFDDDTAFRVLIGEGYYVEFHND